MQIHPCLWTDSSSRPTISHEALMASDAASFITPSLQVTVELHCVSVFLDRV
jgi:hypothetical protein